MTRVAQITRTYSNFSTQESFLALIPLINFLVEKIYDLIKFISCFSFQALQKCCFEAEGHKMVEKGGRKILLRSISEG